MTNTFDDKARLTCMFVPGAKTTVSLFLFFLASLLILPAVALSHCRIVAQLSILSEFGIVSPTSKLASSRSTS